MYEMLRDPVVVKGLRSMPEDKMWVTINTAGDGPAVRILVEVAKQIAKLWYEQGESWYGAFYWFADFLLCVSHYDSSGLVMCADICDNSLTAKDPKDGMTHPQQGCSIRRLGRKSKLVSPKWR